MIARMAVELESVSKHRDALIDAITALKEFVNLERNDPDAIAAIINGALKIK